MQQNKKIPHDLLVRVISTYAEPMLGEAICVPHIVENTLEQLRMLNLLKTENLEDPDAIFQGIPDGAA